MKKIRDPFYFLIILISLQSCVKDATVKLPEVETKLVLSSFICPQDTLIKVSVYMSQPLYDHVNKAPEPVTNATVIISSNTNSWTLPYNAKIGQYAIDSSLLKVKSGETYTLSVSTPEGKFADALTTIPYPNTTLHYTTSTTSTGSSNYTIHAEWQDTPTSTDYYQFELFVYSPPYSDWVHQIERLDDTQQPGGILKESWKFQYSNNTNDTLYAALSVLSSEYYMYCERLQKVQQSGGPFSEPIAMYTNIKGGFGIFAGYSKYVVRVFP